MNGKEHEWQAGRELERIVTKAGFVVNSAKTRMQLECSRQDVTGLVVNKKVNPRAEYRRTARAMTYRLLKSGKFQIKKTCLDAEGNSVVTEFDGTLEQLNGILSFIYSVRFYNFEKKPKNIRGPEPFGR